MQYFYYNGSESHPPCSERIQRFIMAQPSKISLKQLDELKLYGLRKMEIKKDFNVREQQERNNRTIVHHGGCVPPPQSPFVRSVEPAFVKASVPLNIYAMADQGIIFRGDEELDPNQKNKNKKD